MTPSDYAELTAVQLRRQIATGQCSAVEVAEAALARIAEREPAVHAWEHLDTALTLAAAKAVDAGGPQTHTRLLRGIPVAVKDIFDTADLPTRYGSPIYDGFRPGADAACVAQMRAQGGVMLGKTVTTEFAYFAPGPTANPHRVTHTPGGSSSGSTAAVADGMVPIAFGTQTAGSLIRPASYCGVFALKPSFGSFDLSGIKAFAPSLDTLGWLARDANDLELMRCALAGSEYVPLVVPAAAGLRVGVCRSHEWPAVDTGGAAAFGRAADRLRAAGCQIGDAELPAETAGLMQAQKTVMAFEAARQLDHEWRTHAGLLSPAMTELLRAGRACTDAAYAQARSLSYQGRKAARALLQHFDVLMTPAAPGEAPEGLAATGDPIFNRVWTLLGLPCVNVPGLSGPTGLPIGIQLVGDIGQERRLLAISAAVNRLFAPKE